MKENIKTYLLQVINPEELSEAMPEGSDVVLLNHSELEKLLLLVKSEVMNGNF